MIDITDLVVQLVERLGFKPGDVRALYLDATRPEVKITIYQRNDDGHKYLDATGEPAVTHLKVPAVVRRSKGGIRRGNANTLGTSSEHPTAPYNAGTPAQGGIL